MYLPSWFSILEVNPWNISRTMVSMGGGSTPSTAPTTTQGSPSGRSSVGSRMVTMALESGAGGGMREAMLAANVAASIVVMKRGTAVTGPKEIIGKLESMNVEKESGG